MCHREATSPSLISFAALYFRRGNKKLIAVHLGMYTLLFFHFILLLLNCFPELNNLLLLPAASHSLAGVWPSGRRKPKLHLQQQTVPLVTFLLTLEWEFINI